MNVPEPHANILDHASTPLDVDLSHVSKWNASASVDHAIEDRRLARWFQKCAFVGGSLLIALTFGALLWWLSIIEKHTAVFLGITTSQVSLFVGPVIVLGSVGALLALALLRFAFRAGTKEDDEPSPLTLLHGVTQQALDLGKDYFKSKRLAE